MGLNLQNQKNDSADNFLLSAKNIICKDGFLELRKHIRKVANFANPVKFLFPFEEFNVIIAATDNTIYILNERYEVLTKTNKFNAVFVEKVEEVEVAIKKDKVETAVKKTRKKSK